MMKTTKADNRGCARRLLGEVEGEMRRIGLWEPVPPPVEALDSPMPFCHDTLEFNQWLQWVFVPRLQALVEGELTLPRKSQIQPLAEQSFTQVEADTGRLLSLLGELDQCINRHLVR